MQNEQDQLEYYVQIFAAAAKKVIAAGQGISPEGFLFVAKREGAIFDLIPMGNLTRHWNHLRQFVTSFYQLAHIRAEYAGTPFDLKAVLVTSDTYIEDIKAVEFTPEGNRKKTFVPKPGQPEAFTIQVFHENKQYVRKYPYLRKKGYAVFQSPETDETIDSPRAHMANLWPSFL